jgi:hypothetical protein
MWAKGKREDLTEGDSDVEESALTDNNAMNRALGAGAEEPSKQAILNKRVDYLNTHFSISDTSTTNAENSPKNESSKTCWQREGRK